MNPIEHSLPYSRGLDGLRGIAILLVLLFHLWPDTFAFGYVGVDVFFVLSGYLITKIIVIRSEQGKFSFYEFYRNRIRRLFPALTIVLSACHLVGWLFLYPEELTQLAKHTQGSAFFFQNMILIGEKGYWDVSAHVKPLLHFWSLSVEEQFYLIWPLIVLVLTLIKRLGLLVVILALLFWISTTIEDDTKAFYHALSRFWELALGAVAFWFEKKRLVSHFLKHTSIQFIGCFFLVWG